MNWFTKFFAAPQVSTGNGNRAGVPGPAGAAPMFTGWIRRWDFKDHHSYSNSLLTDEEMERGKKIDAIDNDRDVETTYVKVHVYFADASQGDAI